MNRTLALLIPAVLLAAMALIIFQQMNGSDNLEPISINSLQPQTNASNALLPGAADGSLPDQQGGLVSPPAGVEAGVEAGVGSGTGARQNATSSAQTGALSGTEEAKIPNANRTELGRLADAQGAQANQASASGNKNIVQPPQTGQVGQPGQATPSSKPANGGASTGSASSADSTANKPGETTPQVDLPKHTMQSMSFKYQGSEILFVLKAADHFEYKTFLLPSPDRLVIDLAGAWSGLDVPNVPSNRLVKGLRLGKLEKGHRVVLDLKEVPKGYETTRDGNNVTVRIY